MKYALIGCGRIATNHIKAVLNNHLELSAVCDVMTPVGLHSMRTCVAFRILMSSVTDAASDDTIVMLIEGVGPLSGSSPPLLQPVSGRMHRSMQIIR